MITNEQSEMIDLLIDGRTIASIARTLNKARGTIYNWINTPVVVSEIELRKTELRKIGRDKMLNSLDGCIENMKHLAANATDVRVRFQANRYLIDRVLGTPVSSKDEVDVINTEGLNDDNNLRNELDTIKKIKLIK